MRRPLLVPLLTLAIAALGLVPASADATLVAQGMTTLTVKAPGMPVRTCATVSVVQFANSGPNFVLTEASPAGQQSGTPPVCAPLAVGPYFTSTTIRQCTPQGGVIIPGSTLTVAGNIYTIKSPYTTCGGQTATDTITMTVSTTSIVYKHDLTDGAGGEIHLSGTLARIP